MDFYSLEFFLSKSRLDRFLLATNHSIEKAEKLHHQNIMVSRSFYPVLHILEIALRNAMYEKISDHFHDPDWILNEKNGFMSHPNLAPTNFYLKQAVQNAESIVSRKYGRVNAQRVMAEQTFGFWTRQFETIHFRLTGGSVMRCFPCKPRNINRNDLLHKLNKIREFRNRIYHNETICFEGNSMSFDHALNIQQLIYEILLWMDEDLAAYVKHFDDIEAEIEKDIQL